MSCIQHSTKYTDRCVELGGLNLVALSLACHGLPQNGLGVVDILHNLAGWYWLRGMVLCSLRHVDGSQLGDLGAPLSPLLATIVHVKIIIVWPGLWGLRLSSFVGPPAQWVASCAGSQTICCSYDLL